ncbi:hypothetical protein [Deinococcus sp.]|uniref:hypothetical protein n=1 Tax=Deinococcus sp. TaxID=47478 RepID=UPI003CC55DCE
MDGPYQDQFTLDNNNVDFRSLGVITYTFDLKQYPNARAVTLSFKDSSGRLYTQKADLSQFR